MKLPVTSFHSWMKLLSAFSLWLFFLFPAAAQKKFSIKIVSADGPTQRETDAILKRNAVAFLPSDSLSCMLQLQGSLNKFYEQGYLTANYDSVSTHDSVITAMLNLGKVYQWAELKFDPSKEHIIRTLGVNTFTKKAFSPGQFSALNEKILRYYENNGYPFAVLQLKEVRTDSNSIHALMDISPGQLVHIDSIAVTGDAKISKTILYNYLYINPGDLYNESLVKKIPVRIKEINYVMQAKPMQIVFNVSGCYVHLFLNDKKSSQVDGIIGILPGNNINTKTTLTGDLRMRLQNGFAHGEIIDFHWQQPKSQTQDLNVKFIYPFLLESPFGMDVSLSIHKQDTTYIDVNSNLGVNYFLAGGNYIKFYVLSQNSNLLSTTGLENVTILPSYADISKRTFGIGFRKEQLDYRYNPRRGYSVEATAGAGTRTIEKNKKLNPVLYDSLELKASQYQGDIDLNTYIPIGIRNVINLGAQAAALISDNIFSNELFRIGGLRSLRGFDEQSIFASRYIIGKAEYRFILDQGSYLQAFFNAAYYENRSISGFVSDTPFGFGAGLSFETKLGIFTINYALGKQFNNPIYIRSAKIHFGIINYF